MDTIAIVLSVLVGAAGYLVQVDLPWGYLVGFVPSCIYALCVFCSWFGPGHWPQAYTARRAERTATEQARELHLSEQARQREHEQMLSQITRTDRCARLSTTATRVQNVFQALE